MPVAVVVQAIAVLGDRVDAADARPPPARGADPPARHALTLVRPAGLLDPLVDLAVAVVVEGVAGLLVARLVDVTEDRPQVRHNPLLPSVPHLAALLHNGADPRPGRHRTEVLLLVSSPVAVVVQAVALLVVQGEDLAFTA